MIGVRDILDAQLDLNTVAEEHEEDSTHVVLSHLGVENTDAYREATIDFAIRALHTSIDGFPVDSYACLLEWGKTVSREELETVIRLVSTCAACWTEGFSIALQIKHKEDHNG